VSGDHEECECPWPGELTDSRRAPRGRAHKGRGREVGWAVRPSDEEAASEDTEG